MAIINRTPGSYSVKAAHASNVASLSGTGTFGGVAFSAGDIVLLTAQSTTHQNGPYVVRAGAWDRIAHYGTLMSGDKWFVQSGTYAGKEFQLTTAGTITLGTTGLTISQSGGSGMAPATHASSHQNGGADVLTSHATTPANLVWAGPATGADAGPSFRELVAADIPQALNNLSTGAAAPAAAADKVGYGVADINGAATAAEETAYEGGGKILRRAGDNESFKMMEVGRTLADDASITLPLPTAGKLGRVVVNSPTEGGVVSVQSDGTCTKISGSSNLEVSDSDTDLCVFASGGSLLIRNRLGAEVFVMASYSWI